MTRMARGSMSTVYPGAGESLAGFDDSRRGQSAQALRYKQMAHSR